MRLAKLQRAFCENLRDDFARPRLPISGEGLRVYRNNYRVQLRSALESSFPKLVDWLGATEFDRAAATHVVVHPPNSWTLDHYGYNFAMTLEALFPSDPEIAELAWLDWSMGEALVAPDEPPLNVADLAEVDWDTARITFVASLRASIVRSNAADIWAAIDTQSPPPRPASLSQPSAILVWRSEVSPCFRVVSRHEFDLVSSMSHGSSFADACGILNQQLGAERAVTAAAEMLRRWLGDGLIARAG